MLRWRNPGSLPADMTLGQRWGSLRIVGYDHDGGTPQVVTVCLCGEIIVALPPAVRVAAAHLCPSCVPMPYHLGADMARGRTWGQVIICGYERRQQGQSRRTYVVGVCGCGARVTARPDHLRNHDSTSCGCVRRARMAVLSGQRWREVRAGQRVMAVGRPRKQREEAA
jgi:hypothetical protein